MVLGKSQSCMKEVFNWGFHCIILESLPTCTHDHVQENPPAFLTGSDCHEPTQDKHFTLHKMNLHKINTSPSTKQSQDQQN